MTRNLAIFIAALVAAVPSGAAAQDPPQSAELNPAELFAFADGAIAAGDFASAETAFRALADNPEIEVRTEARFRLALMLDAQKRHTESAVLLRRILDEKPDASRVRLELARVLATMGDMSGAARELRQAQAGGLPPDVARLVNIYTSALRSQKPFGASIEVAIAPDSNINRATQSEKLDTVIAQFDLSEDAQAQSGIGLSLRGQTYGRLGLNEAASILVRLSADADLYTKSQFNDISLALQAGPELRSGKDRIQLSTGYSHRIYGGDRYAEIFSASANLQHPVGDKSQVRLNGSVSHNNNFRNDLQDGEIYAAQVGYERAISAKFGAGVTLGAVRQDLVDPGYANTTGSINLFGYREVGPMTLVLQGGYSHLEADERLALFPARRVDDRYTVSLSSTFRQISFQGFSPLLRVSYEKNDSTVGIYDFDRVSTEIGIARSF